MAETLDIPATAGTSARVGELFDRHQGRIYRLALRLSRDPEEARDLVQETFLRAARRPRSVPRGERAEEAWLVRVAVNLCRDRWRRAAVRERGAPVSVTPEVSDPEGRAVARATVRAALARLAPRRRAVVVLRELEGLSSAEVARVLGMSPVTVRWHRSAARRELRRLLDPASEEDRGHAKRSGR